MAEDPNKTEIVKAISSIDVFLDKQTENQSKRLKKTLRSLENRIINLAARLNVDEAGRILGPKDSLKNIQEIQKEMVLSFSTIYQASINEQILEYQEVDLFLNRIFNRLNIKKGKGIINRELLKALRRQDLATFKNLGIQAQNDISNVLFGAIVGRESFSKLTARIDSVLLGKIETKGVPLISKTEQFSHDALMRYYATIHRETARSAGLKWYLYVGNIAGSTRPFCAERAGRIFREDEINSWDNLSWQGQSGSVWTDRGGFRCRHHFAAVKKEWLDDGRIEVQDFRQE